MIPPYSHSFRRGIKWPREMSGKRDCGFRTKQVGGSCSYPIRFEGRHSVVAIDTSQKVRRGLFILNSLLTFDFLSLFSILLLIHLSYSCLSCSIPAFAAIHDVSSSSICSNLHHGQCHASGCNVCHPSHWRGTLRLYADIRWRVRGQYDSSP